MKKRYIFICVASVLMVALALIINRCNKKMEEIEVQINGEYVDFVPYIREFTKNADGSFLDSTANQMPSISVENGDKISLIFERRRKITDYNVVKYEIYEPNHALGSPSAKSEPDFVDVEYEDGIISLSVTELGINPQLIVCQIQNEGYYIFVMK